MKRFTIESVKTIYEYLTYTVEAETEEQALKMVEKGGIQDNDDHWQTDKGGSEELSVTNVEDLDN